MKSSWWMTVGVVIGGVALVGGAGWGGWTLWQSLQQTKMQLASTAQTLTSTQHTLQGLETSHQELTDSYDSVKDQWKTTAAQLTDINGRYAQATREMQSLDTTNHELTTQLEATHRQADTLAQDIARLTDERTALHAETTTLHQHLARLQEQPTISPEELRQLSAYLAKQEAHAQTIEAWLLQLSSVHDHLLEQQLARAPSITQAAALAQGKPVASPAQAAQDAKRLAAMYRELAESYFALNEYTKAARTFERSLTFENAPQVHARLALLYGRFLHDAARAKHHADLEAAPHDVIAGSVPTPAQAYGLPRDDGPLVWDWLVE